MFFYTSRRIKGTIVKTMVRKIGYVDEFLHEHADPLAHFREEAKRLTNEAKQRVCYKLNFPGFTN